jgi:hypothetical protein
VDRGSDPLLLRKSGSAGTRIRDLWTCSHELCLLDHKGGRLIKETRMCRHICATKIPVHESEVCLHSRCFRPTIEFSESGKKLAELGAACVDVISSLNCFHTGLRFASARRIDLVASLLLNFLPFSFPVLCEGPEKSHDGRLAA